MTDSASMPQVHSRDDAVAYELTGGQYVVDVLPERGARVVSLRHGDHGEWLADSDRDWPQDRPSLWADGDTRGWDECIPNISPGPCPELDVVLADHGDVWNAAWEAEQLPQGLATSVRGSALPFAFRRTISVSAAGVSTQYGFENIGTDAYPIAWAMHLLVDAKPENLILPPQTPVRVDSAFGLDGVLFEDGWMAWGDVSSRLPHGESGWALKAFTQPGSVAEVSMHDGRGTLTVAAAEAPAPVTFGLWLNAGGWPDTNPLTHVGIEPGFGDHDSLSAAIASDSALLTLPGRTVTWEVLITAT
jgi:hypothetical protein